MDQQYAKLQLPALRAHIGDWIYYSTFLKMRDIAERVSLATVIHESHRLGELIQRQLMESTHADSIKKYLLQQPQRFFNSLVIGVYGGSPQWIELELLESVRLPSLASPSDDIRGALGVLILDGTEKLFAMDGQHRVVGIQKAVADEPGLADEEVSALFLAHRTDTAGLERTRRLFSTLNRYAKPVSKMEIVALDEDDVVAILTRRLVEEYPLFKEYTSIKRTKAMPLADRQNLTSIVALYDAMDRYFATKTKDWNEFRKMRPVDDEIDKFYKRGQQLWDAMIRNFTPLRELVDSTPEQRVASRYRSKEGGHVLFRPAGLFLVVAAIRILRDQGKSLKDIVEAISSVPMVLGEYPWAGLLWDTANKRMLVRGENQKVALRILVHGIGGDLSVFRTTLPDLRREYAGLLNREITEVKLRKWAQL